MSQETLGFRFGFPTINSEHFEIARQKALPIPFSDSEDISEEYRKALVGLAIYGSICKDDPFLLGVIMSDAQMLEELPDKIMGDFLFGASVMYMVFRELDVIGYKFPNVSRDIAQTYLEEKLQILKGFSHRVKDRPIEDLRERIKDRVDAFVDSVADSDGPMMKNEEIFKENPVLRDFFGTLPDFSQSGAHLVYSLKRRQYISDQLSQTFNQ